MSADLTAQFERTTPGLQGAFLATIMPLAPIVTSVIDGPHVKGSAHFDGRAIDVGGFGGESIGWNQQTLQAIITAIMSRKWTRIGTEGYLVRALRNFARQYGVDMFEDDVSTGATGPHVHLQVGQ